MQVTLDTGYMVFGWVHDEPAGGMRDYLGHVEDLEKPWEVARITDIAEVIENGDWEWSVDVIEAWNVETFEKEGTWWVTPHGSWQTSASS